MCHAHCPQPADGFLRDGRLHEVQQLLDLRGRGRVGEEGRGEQLPIDHGATFGT